MPFWKKKNKTEKPNELKLNFTDYPNLKYITLFLIMPEEYLHLFGEKIASLPRTPWSFFNDPAVIEIVSSDSFFERIVTIYARFFWVFLQRKGDFFDYGYAAPARIFANNINLLLYEFRYWNLVPPLTELASLPPHIFVYPINTDEFEKVFTVAAMSMIEKYNIEAILKICDEYPCHEDYSEFKSNAKTDFFRKWNHSRTKHASVSLEEFKENNFNRNIPDGSIDLEKELTEKAMVSDFLKTLSEKDKQILQMRMEDYTMQEIADTLGYRTHSAVYNRIQKIGKAYEKYAGVDFGFSN